MNRLRVVTLLSTLLLSACCDQSFKTGDCVVLKSGGNIGVVDGGGWRGARVMYTNMRYKVINPALLRHVECPSE